MIYTMTPEQHEQIVDALERPSLKTVSMLIKRDAALAMLKAMKPVEPCGFAYEHQDYIGSEAITLAEDRISRSVTFDQTTVRAALREAFNTGFRQGFNRGRLLTDLHSISLP